MENDWPAFPPTESSLGLLLGTIDMTQQSIRDGMDYFGDQTPLITPAIVGERTDPPPHFGDQGPVRDPKPPGEPVGQPAIDRWARSLRPIRLDRGWLDRGRLGRWQRRANDAG